MLLQHVYLMYNVCVFVTHPMQLLYKEKLQLHKNSTSASSALIIRGECRH